MVKANGKSNRQSRTRADGDATKLMMLEAGLRTVSAGGYAGATARRIAAEGGFNAPLIFYHYGSVDNLLLAVLRHGSERRLSRYRVAMGNERDPGALVRVLRTLWDEERTSPEISAIQELVATPAFATGREYEIADLMQPWFDYTEEVIQRVIGGTVIAEFVTPRQSGFLLVALLIGLEKMEDLAPKGTNMDSLFDAAEAAVPLMGRLIGTEKASRDRKSMQRVEIE